MFKQSVSFLHKRQEDNEIMLDSTEVVYSNFTEMKNTDEETNFQIIRNMGFNVLRIVQPGENVAHVEQWIN